MSDSSDEAWGNWRATKEGEERRQQPLNQETSAEAAEQHVRGQRRRNRMPQMPRGSPAVEEEQPIRIRESSLHPVYVCQGEEAVVLPGPGTGAVVPRSRTRSRNRDSSPLTGPGTRLVLRSRSDVRRGLPQDAVTGTWLFDRASLLPKAMPKPRARLLNHLISTLIASCWFSVIYLSGKGCVVLLFSFASLRLR
jgi:hypothetical protein